jgi:hypothetical protein
MSKHLAELYADEELECQLGSFEYEGDYEQPDELIKQANEVNSTWQVLIATHSSNGLTPFATRQQKTIRNPRGN